MTADHRRPTPPTRLRVLASPELVAFALIVVLAVPAAFAVLPALRSPGATPVGSASPGAASPSPVPSASASPAVNPALVLRLVDANAQLADISSALGRAVGRNASSNEIADLLRRSNIVLSGAREAVPLLAAEPPAAALAAGLDDVYTQALETNRETLRSGLSNTSAYIAGATRLIAALEPLAGLDMTLRGLAAMTPAPPG